MRWSGFGRPFGSPTLEPDLPRPKRYPKPEDTAYLTLRQVAGAMGWSELYTRKFLRKHGQRLGIRPQQRIGSPPRYPARTVETLRAVTGKSYDKPPDPSDDWLARYLSSKEGTNARTEEA